MNDKSEKSEGHKKLERVNRRLGTMVDELERRSSRTKDFLSASQAFLTVSEETQKAVLDLLNGEGSRDAAKLQAEIEDLRVRLKKTTGNLNNRKAQVEELKPFQRQVERQDKAAKRAINDAATRMWGGYSDTGADGLQDLANCPYVSPDLRALACYELARFFADNGRFYSASKLLSDARGLSKDYMRGVRQRVLEYEMLLATDDVETARQRMEEYIEFRPEEANFRIGLANYFCRQNDLLGQIGAINTLYERTGLAPIKVADPENPFLTLTSAEDLPAIEDGPKVTVMMSSYNSADFLEMAVRSMLDQTWRNLELIVTDDCSSDDSREILKAIAAKDPRLVVIENTENHGTYGNRNRMLEVCTGDFITVHDSDDWSHPQMIEHQMKHLMENPDVRLNTTLMCRVSLDLQFHVRPSRASLEYCHMNYPGFLMRTEDVKALGGWDPIMANADAEFERRVKQVYGKQAFAIINPNTTYSFFLVHENSLTQQKLMNLRSLTFGSRNEYHRQSEFWMEQRRAEAHETGQETAPFIVTDRPSRNEPFPSPNGLLFPRLKREVLEYDVLIVSDLFLLGGTRSCNVNYIKMLHGIGKKVAVFNWPRGDLQFSHDIHPTYRQLAQDGLLEVVTWEDTISAKNVIVHHPPLANMELDRYPRVETEKVSVLINQLPFQTQDRERFFYRPADVTARLSRVFECEYVEWIAISPLTYDYISEFGDEIEIVDQIWYPPIFVEDEVVITTPSERFARMQADGPAFARHSRDHWTKWPISNLRTQTMYMTDAAHRFSILGGGKTVGRRLSQGLPETWTVHPYDSITVPDLLNGSDLYLNFNNEVYIEEFGRNVMEALLHGLPVISEPVFAQTFGDSVLVADPEGPQALVDKLITDQGFFEEQVAKGLSFVDEHCATTNVVKKLQDYLD